MRSVRFLRSIAVTWLSCYVAAVVLASLALCCGNVRPGELCPMHRAKPAAPDCVMRAACDPGDATLVALSTGLGVLPHLSTSSVTLQSLDTVTAIAASSIVRTDRPDTPPPRS